MLKAWIAAALLAVVVLLVGWWLWSTRVEFHTNPVVLPTESAVWLAEPRVGFHVQDLAL